MVKTLSATLVNKEGPLAFGSFPAVPAERANTFESVARDWLEVHNTKVKPQSLQTHKYLLEKFVFPVIGGMPVGNLKAPDFLDVLRRIEMSGRCCAPRRASIACSMVMRHAVAIGLADVDHLPSLRSNLKVHKEKHFAAMTDPKDVGRLLRTIWGYSCNFVVYCALKIAPYVFVKPGELQQAKWADIDFESCEWRYTVPGTDIAHIAPLAPQVMKILQNLHAMTGHGKWIFPSSRKKNNPMWNGAFQAAFRSMGIARGEMTMHGFRVTAKTLLYEVLGERYDLIEQQLANKVRDPARRNYKPAVRLAERKRMMCRWADYLDDLREQAAYPFEPAARK
jgi:integrase